MQTPGKKHCSPLWSEVASTCHRLAHRLAPWAFDAPLCNLRFDVDSAADTALSPGEPTPDFALPRIGRTDSSLSDHHGCPVLLIFMPAGDRLTEPVVIKLNAIHRSGDFRVLVVSHNAHRTTSLWADEMQAAFPVFVDSDAGVTRQFCNSSTQRAFLIDEQGRITMSGTIRRHVRSGSVWTSPWQRVREFVTNFSRPTANTAAVSFSF